MRLSDACVTYALQLEADGRSVHTRNQYRRHLRLFEDWFAARGPVPALDEDRLAILDWLDKPLA